MNHPSRRLRQLLATMRRVHPASSNMPVMGSGPHLPRGHPSRPLAHTAVLLCSRSYQPHRHDGRKVPLRRERQCSLRTDVATRPRRRSRTAWPQCRWILPRRRTRPDEMRPSPDSRQRHLHAMRHRRRFCPLPPRSTMYVFRRIMQSHCSLSVTVGRERRSPRQRWERKWRQPAR